MSRKKTVPLEGTLEQRLTPRVNARRCSTPRRRQRARSSMGCNARWRPLQRSRRHLARATCRVASGVEVVEADVVAAREDAKLARRRLREEATAASYLPKGGESGEHALRTYRALRVEPHARPVTSSRRVPVLAESGLGVGAS